MKQSKRELHRQIDELDDEQDKDWSAPLTDEEREALPDAVDAEAWDQSPKRRGILRVLMYGVEEARAA